MKISVCVLTMLLTCSWAIGIVQEGPEDRTSRPGEWAEFTCRVACSHRINWFVEGYPGDITVTCSNSTNNGMMVCSQVIQECSSSTSTSGYIETLRLLAKEQLAGSSLAVQCAGLSRSGIGDTCLPFLAYSRFATLRVEALPTEPPTTVPSPSPSPSPVVCPSATQGVSTVTQMVTVTATVTKTVLITPTVTPGPNPVISRGESHGTHLSKILAEFLSWGMTILAGFVLV